MDDKHWTEYVCVVPTWLANLLSVIITAAYFYAEYALHWEMFTSGWTWAAMSVIGALIACRKSHHREADRKDSS